MKLKTIIIVISIFLIACSDELDIAPTTEKSASNFYSNEGDIETAVVGVYAKLQDGGLYGLDLIGVGEVSGEDAFEEIAANDAGRFGQLDDFSTNAENDLVGTIWRQSYEGIQRANTVLNRIGPISYASEELKTIRIAEMKFVRSLLYFNLVRLYGDVPLAIEETTNPSDYFGQGRSPKENIYNQIEKDLNEAIEALPIAKDEGRPAKGAAQALLGDVLMNQGRYDQALSHLEAVINSDEYALVPSTDAIFGIENEKNSEVVFEVLFVSGENGNSEGSPAAAQFRPSGTTANAKGHNLPSAEFVDMFEEGDTRLTNYIDIEVEANPFYFSKKYDVSSTGADDSGSDYFVIRYADVLLKYAEALNETGSTVEAAIYLNMIRNRAGLANTLAVSQEEMREAIALERRFEFIGEGHRWFDLLRTGTAIEVMNAWFLENNMVVRIDEHNLLLPIPQSQLDTDDAITQNPGY